MFCHYLAALSDARSFAGSRRAALGGLLAAGLLIPGLDDVEAKKSGKKERRKKRGKKKRNVEQPPVPPPPTGSVAKVDASCPGPADSDPSAGGQARLAQTFTALTSGPLVSAQIDIQQSSGTVSDYIARISPVDEAGVPTNDVLATALVPSGSVPEGISSVSFSFPSPFSVVAGTRYALILARPGQDNFTWVTRNGDVCLGQRFISDSGTAPLELGANGTDYVFTTFVSS